MDRLKDQERLRIGNKIIKITILLNILLTLVKVGAGILGNSKAMIADGLHSGSDIITSIGVIAGMFFASKPRDEKHQYGHEKAESLTAFLLAIILTLVGVRIGYESIKMILMHTYENPQGYTAVIAVVSIFIKEYQFRITRDAAMKLNSNALMSDAWHHRSDSLSSIAVLAGIIGAKLGYTFLDPLAGIGVSLIVIKIGVQILTASIDELMDASIEQEKIEGFIEKIEKIEDVMKVTDLRVRKHGSKACVDIKICVNPLLSVVEGHTIGERAEDLILKEDSMIKEVIVHIDPCEEKKKNCTDSCPKTKN
ncbi:cation diffusion facilitator family transporter [Inediibacterium massiliense]|uniref:cation diffusion facilitator family transporter n=1 Tax=Inediibacterium massiliense TaxID=1658111 RepID=UPI000AE11DD5|nr:cation diffusion facilitator family transporter [Inediibacterium massiliense]